MAPWLPCPAALERQDMIGDPGKRREPDVVALPDLQQEAFDMMPACQAAGQERVPYADSEPSMFIMGLELIAVISDGVAGGLDRY